MLLNDCLGPTTGVPPAAPWWAAPLSLGVRDCLGVATGGPADKGSLEGSPGAPAALLAAEETGIKGRPPAPAAGAPGSGMRPVGMRDQLDLEGGGLDLPGRALGVPATSCELPTPPSPWLLSEPTLERTPPWAPLALPLPWLCRREEEPWGLVRGAVREPVLEGVSPSRAPAEYMLRPETALTELVRRGLRGSPPARSLPSPPLPPSHPSSSSWRCVSLCRSLSLCL